MAASDSEKVYSGYHSHQNGYPPTMRDCPPTLQGAPTTHRRLLYRKSRDLGDLESVFTSTVEDSMSATGYQPGPVDEEDKPYQSYNEKAKRMNQKKRVVLKGSGKTNVSYKNISKKRRRYFSDLYTTLLDSSWTYCVIMFTTSFYGSWTVFAAVYYGIMWLHGDLDPQATHEPCISEVRDFASCFLFSLETQHTIGYGTRQTTTQCSDAMIVMSLQAVLGCLIQAFMVGLVFSKLSRPRNRSNTIIFSNQAVINLRNNQLCLVIRIGDLRDDNFILGTQISAKLLRRSTTAEGEMYQEMHNIKVSPDTTTESCIFFVWPLDIIHVIDKDSPFYNLSAADMASERFELLVVMEGTNEISSMTFQSRSSYLPSEIKWGKRFEQMLLYRKDQNKYQVNFSAFHALYHVDTPLCSARDFDQFLKENNKNARQSLIVGDPGRYTSLRPLPSRKTSQFTTMDNPYAPLLSPSHLTPRSPRSPAIPHPSPAEEEMLLDHLETGDEHAGCEEDVEEEEKVEEA